MGCAYVYVVVLTLVGPECLQRGFEEPIDADGQVEEAEVWEAAPARPDNKDVEGGAVVGVES